jgi:hypothetical protein
MVYAEAWAGATFLGPEGVLIPLGIGQVLTDSSAIMYYYNMFAIFTLLILAVASGQRDTKFMAFLIPLWAGFYMYAGWLKYDNMGTGFGVLVVCAMIALMAYMKDTVHEKFGIAGPGSVIVKIFMFLIVLQCVVVFVNDAGIFPEDTHPIAASNPTYKNIDLNEEIPNINNAGGAWQDIVDMGPAALQMAAAAIRLFLECLLSVAAFSIVLYNVFPWISQSGTIGMAFLVAMQFAIWTMYILFIFTIFYKINPDTV